MSLDTAGVLLRGVVGSTAFGLARPGSDIDRLGLFATPVRHLHVVDRDKVTQLLRESVVTRDPDLTMHEIGKYIRLALRCNPTLVDLLYLPEYEVLTEAGQRLVDLRSDFLSETYVRSAYGGYAMSQIARIQQEVRNEQRQGRIAKHARHCFRLLEQGKDLLYKGSLTVRVSNPDFYWAFDEMSAERIEEEFQRAFDTFNSVDSVLPKYPRTDRLQQLLWDIRGI
jgi:predicted nucleotidyltransferase